MADDDDGVVLEAEFVETENSELILSRIENKTRQVERLLRLLQYTQALEIALEDAPTKTRDERCKSANWILVHRVLMATKDVDGLLANLNSDFYDVLMKSEKRVVVEVAEVTGAHTKKVKCQMTAKILDIRARRWMQTLIHDHLEPWQRKDRQSLEHALKRAISFALVRRYYSQSCFRLVEGLRCEHGDLHLKFGVRLLSAHEG